MVEADYVEYHPPHAGRQEIAPLAEEGTKTSARPFEQTMVVGNAEGDFRCLGFNLGSLEVVEEVG